MLFLCSALLLTSLYADINEPDLSLSLMGNLEGRSIIIKVKDKDDKTIGVFKPDSGSTLYRGEYAAYKLSQFVGVADLYPTTQIECMTPETQKKIRKLLAKTNFSTIVKEENRLAILKDVERDIQKEQQLCGAFKDWIPNLQFYYELGTVDNLKKHPIFKYLQATGPKAPHKKIEIKQCTQLVEPKGCLSGTGYMDQMAKDFSSIMLLDAVLGNRDRFPGGNVHFKVNGPNARLFSLDNGAVLKPQDATGLETLKRSGVSRFQRSVVKKLKELKAKKPEQVIAELKLTPEDYIILSANLDQTLAYLNLLEKKYSKKIWF